MLPEFMVDEDMYHRVAEIAFITQPCAFVPLFKVDAIFSQVNASHVWQENKPMRKYQVSHYKSQYLFQSDDFLS